MHALPVLLYPTFLFTAGVQRLVSLRRLTVLPTGLLPDAHYRQFNVIDGSHTLCALTVSTEIWCHF